MKKLLTFILLVVLVNFTMHGQNHAITAANLLAEKKYDAAEKEMQEALANPEEKKNPYTWHINAYLKKEQYKLSPTLDSKYRQQAIEAAKESLKLDTEKKYIDQTKKIINYLAATYLKDAFSLSKSQDTLIILTAPEFYQHYVTAKKITTPNENFAESQVEVWIHMANQFEKLYYEDKTKTNLINQALNYYNKVLEVDPKNYSSNYNIAVDYYNMAVDDIGKIDASTPFWELIYIQEHSIEMFKKSLPYMQEAYRQKPTRTHSLKGLMQIYRALGDEEKYLLFKKKAEESIRNNRK